MKEMFMNGKIIIFEGIDKTGKTTQIKLLSQYLKNKKIKNIVTREPGGTEIGKMIRDILLYKGKSLNYLSEYFLFIADRFEDIINNIVSHYKKGYWVLIDRFHFSSFSYQIFPYKEIDDTLIKIDMLVGQKLFSMISPDKIFYFTKKEYEKVIENKNNNVDLSRQSVKKKDKIEKRDNQYFYKVLRGYELSFLYYKDFRNLVKRIYFEDGVKNNSNKIINIVEEFI